MRPGSKFLFCGAMKAMILGGCPPVQDCTGLAGVGTGAKKAPYKVCKLSDNCWLGQWFWHVGEVYIFAFIERDACSFCSFDVAFSKSVMVSLQV